MSGNHCRAFDLARGRYIAVLHDDDAWLPSYLEIATRILEHYSDVGVVITGALEVSGSGTEVRQRPTTMSSGVQHDPLQHILQQRFLMALPSVTVWRREALDANHRPWPDLVTADVTAFVDPALAGWRIYYQSTPLVRYRVHDDQIGAKEQFLHRDGLVRIWASYRFAKPHHERLRRRLLAHWLLARAGMHLKSERLLEARADVFGALSVDRRASPFRSAVLMLLTTSGVAARLANRLVTLMLVCYTDVTLRMRRFAREAT
jgi:hypothetical protein